MRQEPVGRKININEAAAKFGVSRRTIERWIHDKRLVAIPSVEDARQRLIDPEILQALIEQRPKRKRRNSASASADLVPTSEDSLPTRSPTVDIGDLQAIDEVLLKVFNAQQKLIRKLHPESRRELTLEELRHGPLGRDLRWLAAIARGKLNQPRERILAGVDLILQVLFWPPAAEDYTVPRSFWDTRAGKMLSQAKLRAYTTDQLISIGEATQMLGITVSTAYRWMDDRVLDYVRDDANGRTFIVRRDVENVKRVAIELSAMESPTQDTTQKESLASSGSSGMPHGP